LRKDNPRRGLIFLVNCTEEESIQLLFDLKRRARTTWLEFVSDTGDKFVEGVSETIKNLWSSVFAEKLQLQVEQTKESPTNNISVSRNVRQQKEKET